MHVWETIQAATSPGKGNPEQASAGEKEGYCPPPGFQKAGNKSRQGMLIKFSGVRQMPACSRVQCNNVGVSPEDRRILQRVLPDGCKLGVGEIMF